MRVQRVHELAGLLLQKRRTPGPPSAVGNTHASSVARVLRSSDVLSGTVTQSFTPSNVSAEPNFPAVVRTAPAIVPLLPRPEPSVTPGPLVSSNPQAPTGAVPGGRCGVHREGDPDGLRRARCAGGADGDRPGVVAGRQPRDVRRHRQAPLARAARRRHARARLVVGRRAAQRPAAAYSSRSPSAPPGSRHPRRAEGQARGRHRREPASAGFTVSVTATVFGEPEAPAAVTVTVPV